MADPAYFYRLPIPHGEVQGWASRDRLFRQAEAHLRQRAAAKERALVAGFPDITPATPVDPPFSLWSEADACPIHRFLLAEHARAAASPIAAE